MFFGINFLRINFLARKKAVADALAITRTNANAARPSNGKSTFPAIDRVEYQWVNSVRRGWISWSTFGYGSSGLTQSWAALDAWAVERQRNDPTVNASERAV